MLKFTKIKTQINVIIWSTIFIVSLLVLGFYLHVYHVMKIQNHVYIESNVNQIEENIIVGINNIQKIGNDIAFNPFVREYFCVTNPSRRYELAKIIKNLVDSIVGFGNDIVNISILNVGSNNDTYFSTGNYEEYTLMYEAKYKYGGEDVTTPRFVTFPKTENNENIYYCYIVPVYILSADENEKNKIGTVFVLSKNNGIKKFMRNLKIPANNQLMIVDELGLIVASNREETNREKFDFMRLNDKNVIHSKPMAKTNWRIVCVIAQNELSNQLKFVSSFVIGICFVFLILLFTVNFVFLRRFIHPLEKIAASIIHIGEKNMKQRIDFEVNNELGIITNSINGMLDRIEEMAKKIFLSQQKIYEMEIAKNAASLSALQSQINPHFLYNTLECIKSIAYSYKAKEIARISLSLANMFRYSIKGDHYCTVYDEVNIIKEYLAIMNIRFKDKFHINIDIEEHLYEKRMMKMILQPIVENAIHHGLEKVENEGHLSVVAKQVGDIMVFDITDDGCGINETDLIQLNQRLHNTNNFSADLHDSGIGITNVNNRIKLFFGNQYGLSISSVEGKGCNVTIRLPL